MSTLSDAVGRALRALDCGWREVAPGAFEAKFPPSLRHHFGNRPHVPVVFDPEAWQQDRRSELAAPGSAFLDALERALAERSGRAIRVAGTLTSDGALGREWRDRVKVLNADLVECAHPITFDTCFRFVFEVNLPLTPPRTELVTIACDLNGTILAPKELATRDNPDAYDYDEIAGGIPPIGWPGAQIPTLRERCRTEAERRITRTYHTELAARAAKAAAEVAEARAALGGEMAAPQSESERLGLAEELRRREAVFRERAQANVRIHERTLTLLATGRDSLVVRYRRRSKDVAAVAPRLQNRHVRDDQCEKCREVRTEYVLVPHRAELWCTTCGRACAEPDCPRVMAAGTNLCPRCADVRWCADHVGTCTECGTRCCPDHATSCAVCGAVACQEHARVHALSGEGLCPRHGKPCAVDGAWFRAEELVSCERTADALCAEHRVTVDFPEGAVIRADRVRTCAESGKRMDMDLSAICSVDGRTYLATLLTECALTRRWLHPSHAVASPGDERVLHPDAVVRSTVSGVPVARDRALSDAFMPGQHLHPNEAVRCELSGGWTAKVRSVRVACCGRLVARQHSAEHSVTGVILCRDHLARCAADSGVFRPEELNTCTATGARICHEHAIVLDDPAGAIVRKERVRVCTATGHRIDEAAAGTCSASGAIYKRELLVTCPLTGRRLHPSHGIQPKGDTRLLHPAAIVRSHLSGAPIALDRAVKDELAAGALLHPEEACRCQHSGKWTALARTYLVPCCGRRVAAVYTRPSERSGRPVCDECAKTCAAGHGPLLPTEGTACAVSGRWWCAVHVVATACGREVGPDRAVRMPDDTWECSEHFRSCEGGDHVVAAQTLAKSILSGKEVCPEHSTRCSCHAGVVGFGEVIHDPYDATVWCPSNVVGCVRCGERAPHSPRASDLCRWCAAPTTLEQAPEDLARTYRQRVVPGLPWYTVRLNVRVTGTSRLAYFWIGTLLGGQLIFRATAEEIVAVTLGGHRVA